ncbi:MAG TPA: heme ABC transporter ATP-binding protein, partial [Lactobacillus acetotolerans]|nr:heme ABC transporter ATP-binding protein [Lactobacillus acetotolerans]
MEKETKNIIEMRHIVKDFNGFKANNNINLTLQKGEILALLGENGAGKSTLMRILSGLLEPTAGEIYVRGKKVDIKDPTVAKNLGIGMVHQHFM